MPIKALLEKSFLYNLFSLSRFSHAKKYLLKTLFHSIDPYIEHVLSKDKLRSLNIWSIKQISHRKEHFADDLFFWEFNTERWLANLDHIHGLYEYLKGSFSQMYSCDCKDKTVLDIGGYIGDTAKFFLKHGARRVIIYEPVEKNVLCMKHNLKHVQDRVTIIQQAVADKDGEIIIHSNYPAGHIGFGNRMGRYSIRTQSVTFHSILSSHAADIAKVDCEGNEKYILEVDPELLRKISYWMIEFHDIFIAEKIAAKFRSSGFEQIAIALPAQHSGLYHFRRVSA